MTSNSVYDQMISISNSDYDLEYEPTISNPISGQRRYSNPDNDQMFYDLEYVQMISNPDSGQTFYSSPDYNQILNFCSFPYSETFNKEQSNLLTEYLSCLRSNDSAKLEQIPETDRYHLVQWCFQQRKIDELIEIFDSDPTIDISVENNIYLSRAIWEKNYKLIDYLLGRGSCAE